MSQRKLPMPSSSSCQNDVKNAQGSLSKTTTSKKTTKKDDKNVVLSADGSVFVKTLVQIDSDSDLFMKVAQSAYADHERSLVQCTKCNRRFFPDRIEKHEQHCAAEKLPSSFSKSQPLKSRQKK